MHATISLKTTKEAHMNTDIVEHTIEQLKSIFCPSSVDSLASESQLIQRSSSKLCPMAFLMVMVVEMSLVGTQSLVTMCELMKLNGGLRMTAQALSLRLDKPTTVRFLKLAYSRVLALKFPFLQLSLKQEGLLGKFSNIYLEDSTSCSLHERVAGSFKSSGGGDSSKAGYKIHTIWNATRSCIHKLTVTPGNHVDQAQAFDIVPDLKQGDLVIRDLGYFSTTCFEAIGKAGAFFLSRLKAKLNVYTSEGEKIEDLPGYIDRHIGDSLMFELNIRLGSVVKLPVRLVAYRVPQSVYDQRIRKTRRREQKSGKTLSKAVKKRAKYTILITNLPVSLASSELLPTLYKLRWQIELLFKSFKGAFEVDMIKGQSKHRVECFIVAKLISILVTSAIFSALSTEVDIMHNKELSYAKFAKWVLATRYLRVLSQGETAYWVRKIGDLDTLAMCKKARSRKTSRELLILEASYSEIFPNAITNQELKLIA